MAAIDVEYTRRAAGVAYAIAVSELANSSPKRQAMDLREFAQLIHDGSPYQGFDASIYTADVWGWGSKHTVFKDLVERVKPTTIIEVGTWLGASAIHMADLLRAQDRDFAILCIDTWLGASDLRLNPEWRKALRLRHGYPQLYYQFLANVVLSGHSERIIPLPLSSNTACELLVQHQVKADLIYIDAAHNEADVYLDVTSYWKCLRRGGVMFGDDYSYQYHGVIKAVNRFAHEQGLLLQRAGNKWITQKPVK